MVFVGKELVLGFLDVDAGDGDLGVVVFPLSRLLLLRLTGATGGLLGDDFAGAAGV